MKVDNLFVGKYSNFVVFKEIAYILLNDNESNISEIGDRRKGGEGLRDWKVYVAVFKCVQFLDIKSSGTL